MANGYRTPDGGGLGPLIRQLEDLQRRLKELETPTGTSLNSLVAQVQEAIAEIGTTIDAWLLANSYTKAQIDNLVANPGDIAPGNVTAAGVLGVAGDFNLGGDMYTPSGRVNPVVTSYVAAYINSDGRLGATPSRRDMKDHITYYEVPESSWALRPVVFTYKADPMQTPRLGFYAEDADAADPLLAVHEGGEPYSLHDRALIASLWGMVTDLHVRVKALEGQSQ